MVFRANKVVSTGSGNVSYERYCIMDYSNDSCFKRIA